LATAAYRTRKAVRDAPPGFGEFDAGSGVRTPKELVNHMTNLIVFTAHAVRGEDPEPVREAEDFAQEVERFHEVLGDLSGLLAESSLGRGADERLLQGPLSDAMTHVGQLALLRRLAGAPIAAEDFSSAPVGGDDVSGSPAKDGP
jgi:hypothetical protein